VRIIFHGCFFDFSTASIAILHNVSLKGEEPTVMAGSVNREDEM
jgi:hypothetical protein